LTKTCGSEFGALLRHHLTPQRITAIWMHNYSPSRAQQKTYFLYDLLHTNLFVPSHFWTTCTKFDNCCQHYIVTCRKKLYGFACVIYVLGSRLLLWNILQISQLSVRSAVHKLFRQFLDFSQVLTTISRKLWCHLATR